MRNLLQNGGGEGGGMPATGSTQSRRAKQKNIRNNLFPSLSLSLNFIRNDGMIRGIIGIKKSLAEYGKQENVNRIHNIQSPQTFN